MTLPSYTIVLGIDARHLEQLAHTWPTWRRHKPSTVAHPVIIFYDWQQVTEEQIRQVVVHRDLTCIPWPPTDAVIDWGNGTDKWSNPQRVKMLSGFVHIPAMAIKTDYWLKLDVDTVATGLDDWIDPAWFEGRPAIIAHRWGFTKPPSQMLDLDRWAEENGLKFICPPLNLTPEPDWQRLNHPRIISWCGLFEAELTRRCSELAVKTCGDYRLPVPSQDGFMWYVSQRLGQSVVRINAKSLGWEHWSTEFNIIEHSRAAMEAT